MAVEAGGGDAGTAVVAVVRTALAGIGRSRPGTGPAGTVPGRPGIAPVGTAQARPGIALVAPDFVADVARPDTRRWNAVSRSLAARDAAPPTMSGCVRVPVLAGGGTSGGAAESCSRRVLWGMKVKWLRGRVHRRGRRRMAWRICPSICGKG